jgi:hypothetical protein
MTELKLERRHQEDESPVFGDGAIMTTPDLDENYWAYRVRLTDSQAVLGFPKFFTIGIGFAVEDNDWNTNLPYTSSTEKIFNHIIKNKGDEAIPDEDVCEAIRLIQEAVREDRGRQ